jgi:MYXO-CTERM domain-containing protein
MKRPPSLLSLIFVVAPLAGCVGSASQPAPAAVETSSLAQYVRPARDGVGYERSYCAKSGRFHCMASVKTDVNGIPVEPDVNTALLTADFVKAYQLDTTVDPGITVAITDAFDYPNAESDLAMYRSNNGLPPCTVASGCLTIVNQDGNATPKPPAAPAGDDWTGEAALDLDMVSSTCPKCKILLILTNQDMDDGLFIAQNTAARMGAAVISDSWGDKENGMEPQNDAMYFNNGAAIFVASGDSGWTGSTPDYPSTSAHVIGVGGTVLSTSTSSATGYSETAWSAGGSSCSANVAARPWEPASNGACSKRQAADVAAAASGISTIHNGRPATVSGTSCAAPIVAGIFALTKHGWNSSKFVYDNKSAFNDITTGTNGTCGNVLCKAGMGWDGPTGVGTPNGKALAALPPSTPPQTTPDMAGGPADMAHAPADMATGGGGTGGSGGGGTGGSGGGGTGGSGGGGGDGTGGNGNNGGGGSSGCSFATSAPAPTAAWLGLFVVGAALLVRRRRALLALRRR